MDAKKFDSKNAAAMDHYDIVREALGGLFEVIDINFSERDFYRKAAIDNLKALNENIIEILKMSSKSHEVKIRLRELEFDEIESKQIREFETFQNGV